jgi:hypothetical protein
LSRFRGTFHSFDPVGFAIFAILRVLDELEPRPREILKTKIGCEATRLRVVHAAPPSEKDPLSAAELEEESNLRVRIGDRARAIGCAAGYGLKQAQQDNNRLHQLYCKRISPPSCGGGALPDGEDTEEAQLRARVAAFEESPEGCARRRIRDLEMQNFCGGRSAAEQNELDNLRTLYPDLPLDPDDPLTEEFEAWRRVAAKNAAASKLDRSRPRLSAPPRPFSDDDQP